MRKAIAVFALMLGVSSLSTRASTGAIVESWKYDPEMKVLSMKIVNTSGKDIIAFNMGIILTYADGTTDALANGVPSSERMEDALGAVIVAQMNPYTEALEKNAHGFAAGSTRYDSFPSPTGKDVVDVKVIMNVVIYFDGTAELQPGGERAYKQLMASRKGSVVGMQKVSEIIKKALADTSITNPSEAARTELRQFLLAEADKHYTPEDPEHYENWVVQNAISALTDMTDRTRLEKHVEENDRGIELMLPHTEVTVTK